MVTARAAPLIGDDKSETVPCTLKIEEAAFRRFLQNILPWALRIKGFFRLDSGWKKIDVSGMQIQLADTTIKPESSELVIISQKGLPALMQIYEQWDRCFSVPIELE